MIWKIRQYYQLQTYMKDMDRKVIIKALKYRKTAHGRPLCVVMKCSMFWIKTRTMLEIKLYLGRQKQTFGFQFIISPEASDPLMIPQTFISKQGF